MNDRSSKLIMSRIDWFRDLKNIFEQIAYKERASAQDLITRLLSTNLNYEATWNYTDRSELLGFTLKEVVDVLSEFRTVTWDEILDRLIEFSLEKKQGYTAAKNSNIVSTSTWDKLKESQGSCGHKPHLSNELGFSRRGSTSDLLTAQKDDVKHMRLSGQNMSTVKDLIPKNIIMLDLSHNWLQIFNANAYLPSIRYLKLDSNQITRLSGIQMCKNLTELYLMNNKIENVTHICNLSSLYLLDLSQNNIQYFENIASLAINYKLYALSLQGTPLFQQTYYEQNIKALLPSITVRDPEDINQYSTFAHDLALMQDIHDISEMAEKAPSLPPRPSSLQATRTRVKRSITPSDMHLKFDFSQDSNSRVLNTDRPNSIADILNVADRRIGRASPNNFSLQRKTPVVELTLNPRSGRGKRPFRT